MVAHSEASGSRSTLASGVLGACTALAVVTYRTFASHLSTTSTAAECIYSYSLPKFRDASPPLTPFESDDRACSPGQQQRQDERLWAFSPSELR